MKLIPHKNTVKVLQVRQILSNGILLDDTKLSLIRAVLNNDYGKLTRAEAKRLRDIEHGFSTIQDTTDKLVKVDRQLLSRGLMGYRLKFYKDGTERHFSIRQAGRKALAAYKAMQHVR